MLSQFKISGHPMYSIPPIRGARSVPTGLSDAALESRGRGECKQMADRIIAMRQALKAGLEAAGSTRDWSHLTSQIGMFCYSGLDKPQVEALKDDYSIYITKDGRISMAGVTTGNVEYIAKAIHAVSS